MESGGLKIPCSFHFLFIATIIHDGTTNCDKYNSSKVAYVAGYIKILLTNVNDLFTNFSLFRFPH